MYKNIYFLPVCFLISLFLFCCKQKQPAVHKEDNFINKTVSIKNGQLLLNNNNCYFTIRKSGNQFIFPALHSFVSAQFNGLWIFIGGRKNGFHGKSNNPPPFKSNTANDSIWVVDFLNHKTWSVAVPALYYKVMTATNAAFCQRGDTLIMCGGYTRSLISSVFNTTSNTLLQIQLPALIQYVQSGGSTPSISQVITGVLYSPFIQVTGGQMIQSNGIYYLVGGQNYGKSYAAGRTGNYTNAIRCFRLQTNGTALQMIDTFSVIDATNLHRRDLNLIYYNKNNGSASIFGGVFTTTDDAYLNPVHIRLNNGKPIILVDSFQQKSNDYSTANITLSFGLKPLYLTAFFGGITYEEYDTTTHKLIIGDHGIRMPFSNLISMVYRIDGLPPLEFIQLPPSAPLLPRYLGSNGIFIPLTEFIKTSDPLILDGYKILAKSQDSAVKIGYIYGGIISEGPTSGSTVNGYVPTYANPVLYDVYFNIPMNSSNRK